VVVEVGIVQSEEQGDKKGNSFLSLEKKFKSGQLTMKSQVTILAAEKAACKSEKS
jgi:hypothetical protein